VFLLFVASALLPLTLLAVLSIGQVQIVLGEMSQRELSGAAKTYGMALYERLVVVENALQSLERTLGHARGAAPVMTQTLSDHFAAAALMRSDGAVTVLLGKAEQLPKLPALVTERTTTATRALVIDATPAAVPRILLVRHVPGPAGPALLIAEPQPSYLWGDPETLPYLTDLCVLSERFQPLFCTRALPPVAIAAIRQSDGGGTQRLAWTNDDERFRAASWVLFLAARFDAASLRVVTSQPESAVLDRIKSFRVTFVAVVGLALLIVTLFTVVQVRRRLVPLERLVDATRRIGSQDFATRIEVSSDDEFGELAAALRQMASQLGRQFSVLTTWSEIDRMILTELNIDRIIDVVLQHLPQIASADVIALTVVERDAPDLGRTYVRTPARDEGVLTVRMRLPPQEVQLLLARAGGFIVEPGDPASTFLAPLRDQGAAAAYVLPVVSKQRLVGIVMLGYARAADVRTETHTHVRELADRLAVTLSAAAHEEQLYRQAHYDTLTELPNRLYLRDQLTLELAQAQRLNRRTGLLFIDLDRFKDINDSFGHSAGDHLLQVVAARMRGCVRETDLVARLGGDEFTVILGNVATPRDAQIVAENIMRILSQPILLDGRETFVSCSIGVALFPDDASTADELLRKADTAMYRAKQSGRRRYVFFEERMNVEALERMSLEQDLHRAMGRDEFRMYYQPQVDMRSGHIVGAELLVRWQHPERGLIPPTQFISVAENAGLIEPLGEHLLQMACREFGMWIRQRIAPERLAVNVSSRQFRQSNFADIVRRAIEASNIAPHRLELEITESLLMQDADEVVANFSRLQAMGVRLVIDDFGTGYSSLAYLKRFPIHAVKIDRGFIRDVPASDDAGTLVETIIAMAQALRRDVIAEGVETEAQLAFLRERRCFCIQGYYVSEPLPTEEFVRFLRTAPAARSFGRTRKSSSNGGSARS
jgi:diguanylate cyclase (GGDEF)-like protein